MKWHPIPFMPDMVAAIYAGRKTQTRRVAVPQPDPRVFGWVHLGQGVWKPTWGSDLAAEDVTPLNNCLRCPYGVPGDRLWVRERHTFMHQFQSAQPGYWCVEVEYSDGVQGWRDAEAPQKLRAVGESSWRPAMFMPRWASRLAVGVREIRVQRLQDLTDAEALAEGIQGFSKDGRLRKYWPCDFHDGPLKCPWSELPRTPRDAFQVLWNHLNARRGFGWDANPWVFAVTFARLEGVRP